MKQTHSDKHNAKLLWTGGWDSTFQLLQLLINDRRRVTPFYLLDEERPSIGVEIRTMKRIKERLLAEYPHTQELLEPTRLFTVADVSPDSEITGAFQSICKEKHLGSQYDWLARFCKEKGITDMQLCIMKHDSSPHKGRFDFGQIVVENTDDHQTVYRIDPKFKGMNEYVLFQYFSFPTIKLTKTKMSAIANQQGWEKIMDMTWFCHTPTNKTQPCGKCTPCQIAIKEGFGSRIPVSNRVVAFFYKELIWPLKSLAKRILSQLGLLKYIRKSA